MPKDYAKFVPPKSRQANQSKWPVVLIAAVFFVLAAGVVSGIYFYSKNSAATSAWFDNFIAALHHKKNNAKPAPTHLANAAENKSQGVRFDFYEQLPNMQMPTDATEIANVPPPVIMTPAKIAPMVVAAPANVFNPDEVTQLLDAEQPKPAKPQVTVKPVAVPVPAPHPVEAEITLPPAHFIIQLGEFETETAAKGLLQAINSVGFEAQVVKISREGRKIYKVQQGPYISMALAMQSQQRMQKRGLISTIIKS
jgi:cell division septation protein DedD